MELRQLKSLIESERYRVDPALVAEAMLERRGLRVLLADDSPAPLSPADRSPSVPESSRQAA
jgi:hypothetical protein